MQDTSRYLRFDRVSSIRQIERGLLAEVCGEQLRVELVCEDVVRVKISRGGGFDESPTFAVASDPMARPVDVAYTHVPAAADEQGARVELRTGAMVVSLGLDEFTLDVHRSDGSPVVQTARDPDGTPWAYATLNDAFLVRRRCRQEDAFFGLGEKGGRHNRKGRDFTLWNTDVLSPHETLEFTAGRAPDDPRADRTSAEFDPYYVSIPFCYHQSSPDGAMAGSFLDNGYRTHYDFVPAEEYRIQADGGQYTEYIFAGPRMPAILQAYTDLTGRAALPPLWALGYHQCRWFRYTQDAVEQVAAQHRQHGIPCDTLWLDIEYMDGYRVFTWDTESFPDVDGMLRRLADQGFRVITIVDPGVKYDPGYWVYDQAVQRDVLCRTEGGDIYLGQVWPGNTAFPDFVTPEARAWWGELNAAHVRSGLAGIWNDMNEPATGVIPADRMLFDRGRASHARYHNQYALLMAMGTTTGLRQALPDRRPFVLSRAGFAGIQRYAANWMGDNQARWDHLWVSIPMAMGLGLSGQPFVGADIGGFQGNTGAELFLRWMQFGVLTPLCRNHSEIGNVDQYAWSFGEPVQTLVRDAIRLRYRLLPYLYAAFVQASLTGAPVQRPLVFDHQDDATVRDLDDEYLLGPDLLVAPVIRPASTARQVYLPGGWWYDWHTGELLAGGSFVLTATTMDRVPIYARAGAVVPMWPHAPDSTADQHPEVVQLHLFVPGEDGEHGGLLQEDDGVSLAAESGAYLRTGLRLSRRGSLVELRTTVEGDGYPEFARTAFHLVVHGADPVTVSLDGTDVRAVEGAGDGRFELPNTGQPFTMTFRL